MKKLLIILLPVVLLLAALSACGPFEITYTFDYNYEGAPEPLVITFTNNDRPELPVDPEREGYVFGGWEFDNGDAYNENDISYISLTVKAQWLEARTVSFVINSETVDAPASQIVGDGLTATAPEEISTASAKVVGWCTDVALTTVFDFATPITADTTLYAKWGDKVTVTFNLNYDGAPADFTVEYVVGEAIVLPENPVRADYMFLSWYDMANHYDEDAEIFNADYDLTEDITVYGNWVSTI